MFKRFCLISIMAFISFTGQARDINNKFAVKGAGSVSCNQYVEAVKRNSDRLIAFTGWVDGYLSFHNERSEETFDIAPWQSTKLLSKALYAHCKKKPELTFFNAVKYMIQALHDGRLKEASELVKLNIGDNSLYFYRSIMVDVQKALNDKLSLTLPVDGNFSEDMQRALLDYQKSRKITQSGIPDQDTLQRLFAKPKPKQQDDESNTTS